MIQRLQSIFLLISSLFFSSQFFTAFASTTEAVKGIFSDLSYTIHDNPILLGLVGLGTVISLIAIFLYNNRELQLKVAYAAVAVAVCFPLAAGILYYLQLGESPTLEPNLSLGTFTPIGSIIFGTLAGRYIKKDQKLVSSMDRLR